MVTPAPPRDFSHVEPTTLTETLLLVSMVLRDFDDEFQPTHALFQRAIHDPGLAPAAVAALYREVTHKRDVRMPEAAEAAYRLYERLERLARSGPFRSELDRLPVRLASTPTSDV